MADRIVSHRRQEYRVLGVVAAAGGGKVLQLENLDRDEFIAVAEESCEAVKLAPADVAARIAAREVAMAKPRMRNRIALAERQLARAVKAKAPDAQLIERRTAELKKLKEQAR